MIWFEIGNSQDFSFLFVLLFDGDELWRWWEVLKGEKEWDLCTHLFK